MQGEVMADRTLAFVRKAFNWQMVRDEDFRSPIIKGMMRTNPKERAGDRILSDDEIVDVLTAVDQLDGKAPDCFAPFVRALFYTAQRRCDVSDWHENEFDGDHWTIPAERFKTKKKQLVPLTRSAREQIKGAAGFLISSDGGKTPFSGLSKAKSALDFKIAELRKGRKKMPDWTFHDIRRTCRSLMSRYTSPDHAERVIGHLIRGVRGTYDHHQYQDEKLEALKKLEMHLNGLIRPKSNKVVALRA
jgi:integrase